MLSTYAGTKSFLSSFTGSLNEEVRSRGVDVECVNTYFVVRLRPHSYLRSGLLRHVFAGIEHVEDSPRQRIDPHAQGVRAQCALEAHPPLRRALDEAPGGRHPVLEPRPPGLLDGTAHPLRLSPLHLRRLTGMRFGAA